MLQRSLYAVFGFSIALFIQSTGIVFAQSPLERLESGIRGGGQTAPGDAPAGPFRTQQPPPLPLPEDAPQANGPAANAPPVGGAVGPGRAVPNGQKGYLGAIVDDRNELSRGVRVLSVTAGGPADRAGLKPRDLIYGVGGTRVRQMRDCMTAMGQFGPGDKVALNVLRGVRMMRIEVTLGTSAPQAPTSPPARPSPPLPPSPTEALPSPPGDSTPLAPPSIDMTRPSGPALESPDTRIDAMQKKIDELQQRVDRLEQALKNRP